MNYAQLRHYRNRGDKSHKACRRRNETCYPVIEPDDETYVLGGLTRHAHCRFGRTPFRMQVLSKEQADGHPMATDGFGDSQLVVIRQGDLQKLRF